MFNLRWFVLWVCIYLHLFACAYEVESLLGLESRTILANAVYVTKAMFFVNFSQLIETTPNLMKLLAQ